jgi:hypothetical protein
MNFTEKIAEQCNGAQQCDLSSQPTYIHKCGKISDYLYVSYKCISEEKIFDICKSTTQTFKLNSNDFGFYIKSTDFPTEYPSTLDCSCSISSKNEQSLKMDVLWFSLQDNDFLSLFNKNLTGWINPTYEMPLMSRQNTIRFLTDDSLAYKGFWFKVSGRKACRDDWQLVGDNCVKVFSDALDWRSANQRCQQMNGYLVKIDDVVQDLKLTQYMKAFYPEVSSYWIGLRKYVDQYSQERWMWSNNSTNYDDVSWWPWRKLLNHTSQTSNEKAVSPNNCVVKRRHEDGYFAITCDSAVKNSFICQTETLQPTREESEIKLQCGSTDLIQKQMAELLEFEKIGLASIKNYELKEKTTKRPIDTTRQQLPLVFDSSISNLISRSNQKDLDDDLDGPIDISFKVANSNDLSTTKSAVFKHQTENKLNTTVLAGMVCGIGLVIVIINLGILFICRRNLKSFLKSTKDTHGTQPRHDSDMIQDYFDAFNTFQNLQSKSTMPAFKSKLLQGGLSEQQQKALTLLHNHHHQQQHIKTNINSDDSLLIESAQLFYNPLAQQQQQSFNREMPVRQTSSAFKPFNRDDTLSQQQLIESLALQQQQQQQRNSFLQFRQNQYDKMSHLNQQSQFKQQQQQQNDFNSSAGQYAHTYECLDSLEVPSRNRLGGSSNIQVPGAKNYRTLNTNDSGVDTTMMMMMMNSLQSPNDLNFNNVSTSSASSSSGTSLTQQLIKNGNQQDFLQQQPPQQIITLNDLKHLNHLILNNNSNSSATVSLLNNKLNSLIACGEQTNILNSLDNNGTWSPDSAYYSSIPTLTNYSNNNNNNNNITNNNKGHPNSSNNNMSNQHLQQLNINSFNSNNLNESFKSHLV